MPLGSLMNLNAPESLLYTERLVLRPCSMDDLSELHRHWTDPGVRRFLWDDLVIPVETAEAVIRDSMDSFQTHGFGQWVILQKKENRIIGFCGLRFFEGHADPEILFGVNPEFWGHGLAAEAAAAVIDYGFNRLALKRIYAGADPPNTASFRVMEKLGMKFEKEITLNGRPAVYYSLGAPGN